ncbi:MAG: 3-isopropylmalate dehydratase large subunit [Deltaproteobacteria bacterium]|nr:3-isopropylmalate dehydratase large subunit [Deltaproteobacteria bacterium]
MGQTLVEKILSTHSGNEPVKPDDIVDVFMDVRAARDFGGANVVKNLRDAGLGVADPKRTAFTFDCNPTGSDQKYAANQQACRVFAREHGLKVYDIDAGIGTHLAIEKGLIGPGGTLVSTDSHANILGAIGAFGQGMGDVDIAAAWARGKIWFQVPHSVKVVFKGKPSPSTTAKDLVLAALKVFGANGLLGYSAELTGEAIEGLDLAGRITVASMGTEMGAIICLIPPSQQVIDECRAAGAQFTPLYADPDATYARTFEVDVEGLQPMISRPGHPEDVTGVKDVAGMPVDSVIIGSCTNGRYEDLQAAAEIVRGRKVSPGLVLKIVPATDAVWQRCLAEGLFKVFKDAGALIGNAGCAGCAAGQIGQNGPGEVTLSTGNRNFEGKQGQGKVYLASAETAAASAVAGMICTAEMLRAGMLPTLRPRAGGKKDTAPVAKKVAEPRPTKVKGRVWVVRKDNVDTDMIFHNKHLAITDLKEMGQHTFGNLDGWKDFAKKAQPGDIVVTGKNFGCGSSRQQAVDCFKSLGVSLVIAESFGAIYERNAINNAVPILNADLLQTNLKDGEEIEVDFATGEIRRADGSVVKGKPFSQVQSDIYQRGGLLAA